MIKGVGFGIHFWTNLKKYSKFSFAYFPISNFRTSSGVVKIDEKNLLLKINRRFFSNQFNGIILTKDIEILRKYNSLTKTLENNGIETSIRLPSCD